MRLLLWSAFNISPFMARFGLLFKNKMLMSMSAELKMYGVIDIARVCSMFAIIAYAARVTPKANDPMFPTKIFPLKL